MVIIAVLFSFKNMILGFDFLGFQAIKHFPTKNRIFLHVMQSTITKNSFLLVFYSYVLVFYPYVTGMYLVCARMLLVCTRMYSYVIRMYLYVTRMYSCGVLVMIVWVKYHAKFGFMILPSITMEVAFQLYSFH